MENNNATEQCKLSFFGTITASMTHEIKNSLAIIYESMGFIEDIVLMSEQGIPLDSKTVKEQLNQISRQVSRSDRIMSKLNWFAHSIDRNTDGVELRELFDNLITLTHPLARIKNIQLQSGAIDDSLHLYCHTFHLLNVIFTCIKRTIAASEGNGTVTISGKKSRDNKALIIITDSVPSNLENVRTELPLLKDLMKQLGGEFHIEDSSEIEGVSVVLSIPVK